LNYKIQIVKTFFVKIPLILYPITLNFF